MKYGIIKAEARALEKPKIEPSEVKNMKKKIMKKFADLAAKSEGMKLLDLPFTGKKAFKNKDLQAFDKPHGIVEALRKTCFSTIPYGLSKVNKNMNL